MNTSEIFNLITILVNISLLLVTIGTVLFAKRNVQAIDSPRLVVTRTNNKLTRKDGEQQFIKVRVKNFGNGIALRTYLIVITEDKQCHLSKPLATLENSSTDEIEVEVGFRDEVRKAFVVSNDFFNDYYKLQVNVKFDNSHLHSMVEPVRKVAKYGISRVMIYYWMKKAKKQGNTYPDLIERQRKKELKEIREKLGGMVFVPKDKNSD
ncbi:hypothetical protein [Halobacillus sp. A5]|uniref:hypothetical protein n=1 Tax=Halobacillus sp. A5 TaxID=2880263 RepID=UPI0020A6C592|nr:hypothetical protein [Halobacillus sp. A5]MCP3026908.1 hypothetical protein [Halobacillus sp. A5]